MLSISKNYDRDLAFFEQKNEHEEEAYVKALFNDMLPGFCLVLKNQELMEM